MSIGYRIWELLDFICDVMIMTNQEQVLFLKKYLVLEIIIVLTKSLMPTKGLRKKSLYLGFTQYHLMKLRPLRLIFQKIRSTNLLIDGVKHLSFGRNATLVHKSDAAQWKRTHTKKKAVNSIGLSFQLISSFKNCDYNCAKLSTSWIFEWAKT